MVTGVGSQCYLSAATPLVLVLFIDKLLIFIMIDSNHRTDNRAEAWHKLH